MRIVETGRKSQVLKGFTFHIPFQHLGFRRLIGKENIMTWKRVACSSIGTSHEDSNLSCQDYGEFQLLGNNILAGVVCDGAGSAKYSQVGANIVTKATLHFLENREWSTEEPPAKEELKCLFSSLLTALKKILVGSAMLKDIPLKELSCTLSVVLATEKWMAAMQIGDGFIVVRWKDEESYQLLFEPQHGEYVNQTVFVTDDDAKTQMQIGVWNTSAKFLCLSTDGLEKLALEQKKMIGHAPFFKPFDLGMAESTDMKCFAEEVREFLESEQVNQRVDDDKSLLFGIQQD